jgi:hypothetical protein
VAVEDHKRDLVKECVEPMGRRGHLVCVFGK